MKADLTRSTFHPERHYRSVRMQQGRVQLDADWNEQTDIQAHFDHTLARDLIGLCGAPMDNAGFGLQVVGGKIVIGKGRYYCDGVLCENETDNLVITSQADLPGVGLSTTPGRYLAYLDVWPQHVTALEDPALREVALGGPDTCTRARTVWQVRLFQVGPAGGSINCLSPLPAWQTAIADSTGQLSARAQPSTDPATPCDVPPEAGFRRLENQLYRVEIHDAGVVPPGAAATFKWSRDNGSVVTKVESIDLVNHTVKVSSLGRDAVLGFAANQWVEIIDAGRELRGETGILAQIIKPPADNTLAFDASVNLSSIDAATAKARRWDSAGPLKVEVPATNSGWIPLEDGVEVKFEAGSYRTGDYWLIPARTNTGDVEWPRDATTKIPVPKLREGIRHHYCRLALLDLTGTTWSLISDCRALFPPVTELTSLFYVSGDGQEVMPDLTQPATSVWPLAQPLKVGVANGSLPVAGARVRFKIKSGAGQLQGVGGTADVLTDSTGVAACTWSLDGQTQSQQVEATLLDPADNPVHLPVRFTANLSVARQVAYDPAKCVNLKGITNVQDAIDGLCAMSGHGGCCLSVGPGGDFATLAEAIKSLLAKKVRDICLCLLAGRHSAADFNLANDLTGPLHLRVSGCGRATHLSLEKPAVFKGLTSLALRDLEIFVAFRPEKNTGAITADSCDEVNLSGCRISGVVDNAALVLLRNSSLARIQNNIFEAALSASMELTVKVLTQLVPPPAPEILPGIFGVLEWPKFEAATFELGQKLAQLDADTRTKLRDGLLRRLADRTAQGVASLLSPGELASFASLGLALPDPQSDARIFAGLLTDIREAAILARSAAAVVLGDLSPMPTNVDVLPSLAGHDGDFMLVENNRIGGAVCLMGLPEGTLAADKITPMNNSLRAGPGNLPPLRLVGLSGTLELRGNQVVRIAASQAAIDLILKAFAAATGTFSGTVSGLLGRCALSENVIGGAVNLIVSMQMVMSANRFTLTTMPVGASGPLTFIPPLPNGISIADNAVFVGNQGREARASWQNVSRVSDKAANVEISFT